jgi:hypothetical protein
MIRTFMKQFLATTLSFLLIFPAAGQQPAPTGYSGQGAPLPSEELQQLVAPIALYPDALVAQILGAATFPDQVAAAVLDNMTKNLSWTSPLGEAYHTQATDVMSAVQVLRAKAKAAGNLKSGSQITVVQQGIVGNSEVILRPIPISIVELPAKR